MSDTIDLLEAIGRDASLRHAAAAELLPILEKEQASDALKAAVAAGDRGPLAAELGDKTMHVPQITQGPSHGDGDGDGDHEHDKDHDHDHDKDKGRDHRPHDGRVPPLNT